MASFNFDSPAITAGTTFVFGSWSCTTDGSGGFASHLIKTTNAEALQQELDKITSAEFLLPQLEEEIERMSLSDTYSTRLPFGLDNSAASYSAIIHQKNFAQSSAGTRTAPQFDFYPDSDDDFDADLLDCLSLTILATPQNRVACWKDSESSSPLNNAQLVACLQDLPYQSGRPLSPIREEGIGDTALVDYSTSHSTPDRQVYVSLHGDDN